MHIYYECLQLYTVYLSSSMFFLTKIGTMPKNTFFLFLFFVNTCHLFDVIYFASANRVRANDQQQMRMMAFQNFMEQFKLASGPKMISKGSNKGDIKFSNVGPISHESSVPKLVTINICVRN